MITEIYEHRESKAGRICGEAEISCATTTKHFLIITFEAPLKLQNQSDLEKKKRDIPMQAVLRLLRCSLKIKHQQMFE